MKKQTMMKILLILLPIMAVGLATTTDSVMVFDSVAGTTEYYSYFEPLTVGSLQMLTPLAGVLGLASGILAGIYLAAKKGWCLKVIVGTAFCSATVAVLPILLQSDVKIIPNVGVPIFMMVECLVAYLMMKMPAQQEKKQAPRLDRR